MHIGAAEPEGADSGNPSVLNRRPVTSHGRDFHREAVQRDMRVQRGEIAVSRNALVAQGLHHLDQRGNPGSRLQMADVGFHRTDHQRFLRRTARREHLGQRLHFDGIAERGAGAVRFDIGHRARIQPGILQRLADHRRLSAAIRRGQPGGAAILVNRAAANHRQHPVAIGLSIRQPFQDQYAATFAPRITVCRRVKGLAAAIGGQHPALTEIDGDFRRQHQVDAGHQRHRAFPLPQGAHRQVSRDHRRGTGGVNRHARSLEAEGIGNAPGGDAG